MRNYIYTPIKKPSYILTKLHYVYKTTNLLNGKYYIGKHSQPMGKIDKYYGSGSIIRDAIKKYKKNSFKKEIICFCNSSCDAYDTERQLVNEDVVNDPSSYNILIGGTSPMETHTPETRDRIRKGIKGIKHSPETRKRMSDAQKGMVVAKDRFGNTYHISTNDSRYISGELVSMKCGKVMMKDEFGKFHLVDQDDHRIQSGELVGVNKGKSMSEDQKKKISESLIGEKNPFFGKTHTDDALNAMCNHYIIDGESYRGRSEIAKKYNISIRTVTNRCNSDNWDTWILVKRRV